MPSKDNKTEGDQLPPEIDRGLDLAFGGKQSKRPGASPAPSILEQIGEVTGKTPLVYLREVDQAGHAPVLQPLAANDDLAQGAGKYIVHGKLGEGGVGVVHKGYDKDLGRDVAIKFLHERYTNDSSVLYRFVEEAQLGGQLQHPGIVPVYELGMSDGRAFFAMKMVKGETLAKELAERRSPADDRRKFLSIFEDVCQTMAYVHMRGVVHRDLKPANIMIGAFGEVQIVDWGMGKVLQSGGLADEELAEKRRSQRSVIETTRSSGHGTKSVLGSVMGTPAYMPPEQARGEINAMDERSDVFALGAMLCEILTGQPPYVGDREELLKMASLAKLDDAHARLAACGAEPDLVELVTMCLMPSPAARPQSASVVAQAVYNYLAAAEQRIHDAMVRAVSMKRTQRLATTLIGVILLGLTASLWFWRAAERHRGLAELAATEANAAEETARTAQAKEESARNAAEANLANFNILANVVRLEEAKAAEEALYPAWPESIPAMRTWLSGDAKAVRDALPRMRHTLATLRARALPAESAEPVEAFALDESRLPKTPRDLHMLAWPLVAPDREVKGREAEGLALARLAVSLAPEAGDDRAIILNTLAWALSANGQHAEALEQSEAALATASADVCIRFSGYLKSIRKAGPKRWRFADATDAFLHDTLRTLVGDAEDFVATDFGLVEQRLSWAEQVQQWTITRHQGRWEEARLSIIAADGKTASKLYGADGHLEIVPQLGLVPIGMNPVTKLWEFYHLRSAWDGVSNPADIAIPEHRADGSIDVTDDLGIVFVLLPGGDFTMGTQNVDSTAPYFYPTPDPFLETLTETTLGPFFLARHEMTQGQWARLSNGDASLRQPSYYQPGEIRGGHRITWANPVEQVTWTKSSRLLARQGLVLPLSAQWEYGCRAGTTTVWWPGSEAVDLIGKANLLDEFAASKVPSWGTPEPWDDGHVVHAPVGTFAANAFGLYDTHGNVWEWCRDKLHSAKADIGRLRCYRGGCFSVGAAIARSANKRVNIPSLVGSVIGLRPARAVRFPD